MKSLRSLIKESVSEMAILDQLIKTFHDEFDFQSAVGMKRDLALKEPGLCATISTEFIKWLSENDFSKKAGYEVVEFIGQVGSDDKGAPINHHTAVYVDSETIIDFTLGQFAGKVLFFKGTKSEWEKKITSLTKVPIKDINVFVKMSDFKQAQS